MPRKARKPAARRRRRKNGDPGLLEFSPDFRVLYPALKDALSKEKLIGKAGSQLIDIIATHAAALYTASIQLEQTVGSDEDPLPVQLRVLSLLAAAMIASGRNETWRAPEFLGTILEFFRLTCEADIEFQEKMEPGNA